MGALQLPQYDPDRWSPEPAPPRLVPVPPVESAPTRLPRLTKDQALRRRRLVVLLAASLLLLGVVAGGTALFAVEPSASSPEPVALVDQEEYVVQPGDTLWTIAKSVSPDADPRPLVAELRSALGDVELEVGDRVDLAALTD